MVPKNTLQDLVGKLSWIIPISKVVCIAFICHAVDVTYVPLQNHTICDNAETFAQMYETTGYEIFSFAVSHHS